MTTVEVIMAIAALCHNAGTEEYHVRDIQQKCHDFYSRCVTKKDLLLCMQHREKEDVDRFIKQFKESSPANNNLDSFILGEKKK